MIYGKEFVKKFKYNLYNKIQKLKPNLMNKTHTLAATTIIFAILSIPHVVYAASTEIETYPQYQELLENAKQKVQVANQPLSFGNGVPYIKESTSLKDAFPAIGLMVGITVTFYIGTRILEKRRISQLINTAYT
jgi:hypothetical protein